MNVKFILSAALLACVTSTVVNAQTTQSALVDSTNKQLQRSPKPAKSGNATALKASSATNAKPTRVVQAPAIATQSSSSVSPKVARVAVAADSVTKAPPPVMRSAKVVKTKPPAE